MKTKKNRKKSKVKVAPFYLIGELTVNFDRLKPNHFEDDLVYRYWQLKLSLTQAQQLAMISRHLREWRLNGPQAEQ